MSNAGMGSSRTSHLSNSKLAPLKKWATQIAADMIQRVFVEFEREAGLAFDEVAQMRGELVRVSELLEGQMQREKELHALMDALHAQNGALAGHAANKGPGMAQELQNLHHMLDQCVQASHGNDAQSDQIMQKLQHALAQADGHKGHANNLKEQSVTTEHELARIKQLLAMPNPNAPPMSMMGGPPPTSGSYGGYGGMGPPKSMGGPQYGGSPAMSMASMPATSGMYR